MTVAPRAGDVVPGAPIRLMMEPILAVGGLVVLLSVDLGPHGFPEWSPVRTVVLAFLAVAGVMATVTRPISWADRSMADRLLIGAFGWVALTAPLAADPAAASLVAAALLGTVLMASAIAYRWPIEQALIGASLGCTVALGASALVGSSTNDDGRWAGLTEEPNSLGVVAAFAVVVGLATVGRHRIGFVSVGLGLITLLMTSAALPAAAAGVGALFILLPLVPGNLLPALAGSVVSLVAATATSIAVISTDSLPGDGEHLKTLNNRTGIWSYLFEFIAERPILGHGAGSTRDLIALGAFDDRVHWTPTHAHNALIEIAVAGALPAALLLTAAVVASLYRARWDGSLEVAALGATFAGLALTEHLVREPTVALLMLALAAPLATVSSGSRAMSDVPSSDDIGLDNEHHGAPRVEEMA
jgi:O-antigen ligase